MRYDNDVNAGRGIREQVKNFVRNHLSTPRRAATLGLVAAVGTGALMLSGAPNSAAADPTMAPAAAVTHALNGKAATAVTAQQAAKTTSTKNGSAAAAARTKAMLNTPSVAGLDKSQMKNAALIVQAGQELGISERGQIVAMSTAMQESNLYNRASDVVPESMKYAHEGSGSDYDSVGLFQQRYTTGWGTIKSIMDPKQSAGKFYKALQGVDGWESMPVTVAAQTVQGSAFPDAYAKHQGNATAVVKAVNKAANG